MLDRKDIDVADPMAQRALTRLEALPRLQPSDPEDKVPVPFEVDEAPGYAVGKILTDQQWLAQPVATFFLRELCATQAGVRRAKVREFILNPDVIPQGERGEYAEPGVSVPHIVRFSAKPDEKSELYIDNGHHHLTAIWLLGRSEVSARFLDLTQAKEPIFTVSPEPAGAPSSTYGPEGEAA